MGCRKRVLVRESAWLGDEWVRTWLEAVNALMLRMRLKNLKLKRMIYNE